MAHVVGHGAGQFPALSQNFAAHTIEQAIRRLGNCSGFRLWVFGTCGLVLIWLPAIMGVPV